MSQFSQLKSSIQDSSARFLTPQQRRGIISEVGFQKLPLLRQRVSHKIEKIVSGSGVIQIAKKNRHKVENWLLLSRFYSADYMDEHNYKPYIHGILRNAHPENLRKFI